MGNKHDWKTTKQNDTTRFLVSPIGISKKDRQEHGFIGAYLGDINKPEIEYERGIFMLFKPPDMSTFGEWLEFEKLRTFSLAEEYDYDGGYVVVIYILDDEFAEDYEKFLDGQYSRMSRKFKDKFEKGVVLKDNMGKTRKEPTFQWRIFKKDPEMRQYWEEEFNVMWDEDMEVWRKPHMDREMLDINKIKNNNDNDTT